MVQFIVGFFAGALVAVFIMCLAIAAADGRAIMNQCYKHAVAAEEPVEEPTEEPTEEPAE